MSHFGTLSSPFSIVSDSYLYFSRLTPFSLAEFHCMLDYQLSFISPITGFLDAQLREGG